MPAPRRSTPERLMDAALHLVAENGYRGTSVGAVEQAAGLAPRSGALYQHFRGKDDVLEAAIQRELAAMDELASVLDTPTSGDLKAELTAMARWNLDSLDRRAQLAQIVRRDAHSLPPALLDELYTRLVARPYDQIVSWLAARFAAAGVPPPDLHPLALIMIEPMASYRFMRETFGRTPDAIDDERFIAAWVDVAMAVARQHGLT
jgi:AcrR family transcriptional regulator